MSIMCQCQQFFLSVKGEVGVGGGAARGEEGEISNTVPLEELVENRIVMYKCNYSIKY